ncbi:MAG: tetratricopeptide repeat protein, partial [Betaproteobacteria bacterium]|nr:tetratricopeptide repeat protein [Betaproteobacteria bacterium]
MRTTRSASVSPDAGRWDEAVDAYRCAVDLTPRFAAGWSGLGLAALHVPIRRRGPRSAISNGRSPSNPTCLSGNDLGTALQRAGELAAARKAYEQVLARNPGRVDALFNLGAVAQEQVINPRHRRFIAPCCNSNLGFAAACSGVTGRLPAAHWPGRRMAGKLPCLSGCLRRNADHGRIR